MSLFLVLWILSQDEEVIIATTRFFRDPYKAGVPKSTPVEQKDARPGSMVDQIVGRSDTTMRNTDDTTSIDIGVLHRIAQDWYKRLQVARDRRRDHSDRSHDRWDQGYPFLRGRKTYVREGLQRLDQSREKGHAKDGLALVSACFGFPS